MPDGNFMKKLKLNIYQFLRLKTSRISVICIGGILPLFIFASLFLLSSCEREDMYSFAQNKLAIGDKGPGGGIVFYVTDGGLHGLEVAPSGWYGSTPDPTSVWIIGTYASTSLPGISTALGTGKSNTSIITSNGDPGLFAARMCRDYHGGNKDDWFLPSKDELQILWNNLVNNGSNANNGVGGLSGSDYLSSSEMSVSSAHLTNFFDGTPNTYPKNVSYNVRPIRSF